MDACFADSCIENVERNYWRDSVLTLLASSGTRKGRQSMINRCRRSAVPGFWAGLSRFPECDSQLRREHRVGLCTPSAYEAGTLRTGEMMVLLASDAGLVWIA